MVSFQTPISPNQTKTIRDFENSSKKRKLEETEADEENFNKAAKNTKPVFDIELHLGGPLPLEWQRCLDLQSGQIHFYNTRTKKRTSKDPRHFQERSSSSPSSHMSLDLELNLPYESLSRTHAGDHNWNSNSNNLSNKMNFMQLMKNSGGLSLTRSPSIEADDQQEMVAAVCMRCHMLVMLFKSSPACPNCKFMHPPHPHKSPPPDLFKLL
ncbi:hypothetical protein HHK36_004016 [Tetracentron sinense]|uniref:WW domain-containing protein n=1 Tax=Tetracentron sinense TaxID=13715 RepID=A0A834ZTH8_TETSI|nr:hypothetical protein HHK36_004016 [Tetracentron sinense]